MTEAEKSNERQAAYSEILHAIWNMKGRKTVPDVVKLIQEIARKDEAWKELEKQ